MGDMNPPFFATLFRCVSVALIMMLASGCSALPWQKPHHHAAQCPPQFSFHYVNAVRGFSLCLPAGVQQSNASGYPAGTVIFTGFAVPAGTNLESKKLLIVPGAYSDIISSATAFGHFTADGVTFKRTKFGDGSAGHMDIHIIYTWTNGSKKLNFDFDLHSVNPGVYDPSNRPAEYNLNAQVKNTEEIMSTFKRLH